MQKDTPLSEPRPRGLERHATAVAAGRAYASSQARFSDHHKAATYYRQAAEAGDPSGMHNYGAACINGQGVPHDPVAGRAWIEKSAQAGLAAAQHTFSILARRGVGGERDPEAFVQWAQRAADQGLAPALYDLGIYFLEPDGAHSADPARAAEYLRLAALKQNPAAQYSYAMLCEHGVGVPANNIQAFVHFALALRGGQSAAQERLDKLRGRMSARELAAAQKLLETAA